MNLARLVAIAGLAFVVVLGAASDVGSDEQNPGVFIPLRRGCELETHPLTFSNYDPLIGRAVDAVGSLRYTCAREERPDRVARDVRIEMSRGSSNSYDRSMTLNQGGTDRLRYNVYLDATQARVWGDGSSNTDYYLDRHPPNASPVIVPFYGRIFSSQDVEAGSYADLLQVTILF